MKYAVLLLALMFVGIATPSMAQKPKPKGKVPQKLTFEFEGQTIEVAKKDFPNMMNWDDAMSACEGLGNGWRLPNKDELAEMYKQLHAKGKVNFRIDDFYWSSSESSASSAWFFDFEYGKATYCYNDKDYTNHVRAVRALP